MELARLGSGGMIYFPGLVVCEVGPVLYLVESKMMMGRGHLCLGEMMCIRELARVGFASQVSVGWKELYNVWMGDDT